ncbi:MAG: NADH-quinone oxidoreductase subunit C [Staphylothermus sp.]|nr:NADH-quinone oxidoreductase subunit C [Staphylothermus sp.]
MADSVEETKRNLEEMVNVLKKYADNIEFVERVGLIVRVKKERLREVSRFVHDILDSYFRTMAAVDERPINNTFAAYYVFGKDEMGLNIIIETHTDPLDPEIPSISDLVPAADWYELEAWDLLGIKFTGRRLYRFILPDEWPEGLYPLRKDVDYNLRPVKPLARKASKQAPAGPRIPFGPYHPALHEPEYFELFVEGEKVVDVRYNGFHVHRGIEKLAESPRFTYQKVPFLAERICGICGFVHSVSYTMSVERAAKIDVPERAEYIRSIILEVERLHSHLLWIGVACHLLGYDAGFMHSWRIREKVMVLSELLTGSRKTYGINLVGGVRKDINKDKIQAIMNTLKYIKEEFSKLVEVIAHVPQIVKRATGTGILPRDDARKLSVVGPVARGSGLNRDVRKDYPYAAYPYVSFKVPVYSEGDNLARLFVRIDEVFESINILEQLLDKIPQGPIFAEKIEVPEGVIGIGNVEAPRGEAIHVTITGKGRPYRWRVRAPTYQNIPALKIMLKDAPLADAPLTIASIDPCFSCTDRLLVIDLKTGKAVKKTMEEIIKKKKVN